MKKFIVILCTLFIFSGCSEKIELTELQKSNLLVEAEVIKNSLCGNDGKEFYNLYEKFLETQDSEIEEEIRVLLDEEWAQKIELQMQGMGATYLEAENFKLQAQEIARNLDFFDENLMGELADLVSNFQDFPSGCDL